MSQKQAYWRGYERGRADATEIGERNPAPLSGEWGGESIPELLGDLYKGCDPNMEDIIIDNLCDSYERGYDDGYDKVHYEAGNREED
jgi:hypothetical protein